MAFDLKRFRLERFNVEATYHAAYTFYGLKGVLAERWGHGPVFGAVGEVGSGQLNLTPAPGERNDERLVGVAGMRTSALLAEGPHWARRGSDLAQEWLEDVYTVLKPQRTVYMKVELFGIYPLREPRAATRRLIAKYYNEAALDGLVGDGEALAAVEIFGDREKPNRTVVMGAIGPPHVGGGYFTLPSEERDRKWWMGIRLAYSLRDEDGINAPLELLNDTRRRAANELARLARSELPGVVGDA